MKKLIMLLALVAGSAFGQLRFSQGVFYYDLAVSTVSNATLIGSIPAGSCLTEVLVGPAVMATNTASTNYVQIGISGTTGYFLGATALPVGANYIRPLTLSNAYTTLSATKATPIYAYFTRLGASDTAVGTYRIVIRYIQK